MILVENIDKKFAGKPVLSGATLHLSRGERIVLSGPSGSGKTTLLRLIAGLEDPDAGRIEIDGVLVNAPDTRVPPNQRGIGVVFQQPALWSHMSVQANLDFVIKTPAATDRAALLTRVAALCGLTDLLTRKPDTLSAGQAHRVALARALASSPRYLLMDEPTSNLDAPARSGLNAVICAYVEETNAGLLYISHEASDISQIGGIHLRMTQAAGAAGHAPAMVYAGLRTPES